MQGFLITACWFLVAIMILVTVHEFGHYYVAKRCGVKVLRFSIGFGNRLLRWQSKSGTEFAISAIPLGGYIKMLDEREVEVNDDERHMSYNSKTVWQRIAIAAAGPAANIILAFALFWVVALRGTVDYLPVIGEVEPSSPAAMAGIESGQKIISVDGEPTITRRDVMLALINRLGHSGEIEVVLRYPESADDYTYESHIVVEDWLRSEDQPDTLKSLGIRFFIPAMDTGISQVVAGSAAEKAGLQAGDLILEANGEVLREWRRWVEIIQSNPEQSVDLVVLRQGRELEMTIVPDALELDGKLQGRAGVAGKVPRMPESMMIRHDFGLAGSMFEAAAETKQAAGLIFLSLKKLVTAEISVKNLSGPIGVAKVAADHARYGFWAFIVFLANLSVVLAVLNILPIPVLDGGHILYCLAEWIKGSPVSERVQLLGLQAGMALLLCVMVVAFYNDILRL